MEQDKPENTPSSDAIYRAPQSAVLIDHRAHEEQGPLPAAGRWRRLFNYLIDYVAQIGLVMAVFFVLSMLEAEGLMQSLLGVPDFLLGLASLLVYYLVLESLFGRTLGKLVTGTLVTDAQGQRVGPGKVLARTLCRLIPFEAFSIFTRGRICWHDQIPGTRVVELSVLRRWQAGEVIEDDSLDDALPESA
ncbi:hypothetical protein A11A3_01827 [Alcanivorax hongdengensis A-11-3]|uniref:RDD domain-containing protein n=1 Tax=Alcanivorax hongdengensis A-11-3 TaxID=1177179 RepID=L0WIA3_9GAMM|nr:RDD family protein [Alcanivorax hongdengensis]EKF75570.1 hypothetical protein A11A3_01827 [Alcanivorax hongdengensis A-11-3]